MVAPTTAGTADDRVFALFVAKLTDPLTLVVSAVVTAIVMLAASEWIKSKRLQLGAVLAAMLISAIGMALASESTKVNGIYCPEPAHIEGEPAPGDIVFATVEAAGLGPYQDCFITARTTPQLDWQLAAVQLRVDDNETLSRAVGADLPAISVIAYALAAFAQMLIVRALFRWWAAPRPIRPRT
jgi:hypothetical protein